MGVAPEGFKVRVADMKSGCVLFFVCQAQIAKSKLKGKGRSTSVSSLWPSDSTSWGTSTVATLLGECTSLRKDFPTPKTSLKRGDSVRCESDPDFNQG